MSIFNDRVVASPGRQSSPGRTIQVAMAASLVWS